MLVPGDFEATLLRAPAAGILARSAFKTRSTAFVLLDSEAGPAG